MTTARSGTGKVVASVALAAVMACSACSSSPPASTTPSVATLTRQFLAIISATDKTLAKDTSQAHLAQSNSKYAVAFRAAGTQIAALKFPGTMKPQVTALVSDLDIMATDAVKVSVAAAKNQTVEKNVLAMATQNLKLMEEETAEKAAANALRHDLGLPPVTTTTTAQNPSVLTPQG
jgi:hypothetical protein